MKRVCCSATATKWWPVPCAELQGVDIAELSLDVLRQFSTLIEDDVYAVLTPEGSLAQRN